MQRLVKILRYVVDGIGRTMGIFGSILMNLMKLMMRLILIVLDFIITKCNFNDIFFIVFAVTIMIIGFRRLYLTVIFFSHSRFRLINLRGIIIKNILCYLNLSPAFLLLLFYLLYRLPQRFFILYYSINLLYLLIGSYSVMCNNS